MSAGLVLVVCKDAARLERLDAESLAPRGGVELSGRTGHEVSARPGSPYAYVPIFGTGVVGGTAGDGEAVDVIDLHTGLLHGTLRLPRGSYPHDACLGPDGRLVVTCEGRSSLWVLDAATGAGTAEIPLPAGTGHMVAVSADGTRAWTVHVRPGLVVEVDLRTGRCGRGLPLTTEVNRIALAADHRSLFVADQTAPRLAVIDVSSMTVSAWVDLPGIGFSAAARSDGTALVVALRERNSLVVLDLLSHRVTAEIPVPPVPQSVVLDASGRFAYVSCTPADQVVKVDLARAEIQHAQPVGPGADGLALWVAEPPLPGRPADPR